MIWKVCCKSKLLRNLWSLKIKIKFDLNIVCVLAANRSSVGHAVQGAIALQS